MNCKQKCLVLVILTCSIVIVAEIGVSSMRVYVPVFFPDTSDQRTRVVSAAVLTVGNPDVNVNGSDVIHQGGNDTATESNATSPDALITMFTTMRDVTEKRTIHNNTLMNWSALKPRVNLILYVPSDSTEWIPRARALGWMTKIIPKTNDGLPVLRSMYMDARNTSRTPFYAYANADILFNEGLIRTLEFFVDKGYDKSTGFLGVGLRVNVNLDLIQDNFLPPKVAGLLSKGKTFVTNAQDYFITSAEGYPWPAIPDFVVGRRAYDNWLVVQAIVWEYTLVDCTKTIPAVHQTGKDGNFAGHHHKNEINPRIAPRFDYSAGHTLCAPFVTAIKDASLVLVTRKVTSNCKIKAKSRVYKPNGPFT